MPTITFNATFVSRQEIDIELTEQEWADLQSGKKKYYDFLDSGDYDSGEWTEGSALNSETMEFI